jgi:hypothetical protein
MKYQPSVLRILVKQVKALVILSAPPSLYRTERGNAGSWSQVQMIMDREDSSGI